MSPLPAARERSVDSFQQPNTTATDMGTDESKPNLVSNKWWRGSRMFGLGRGFKRMGGGWPGWELGYMSREWISPLQDGIITFLWEEGSHLIGVLVFWEMLLAFADQWRFDFQPWSCSISNFLIFYVTMKLFCYANVVYVLIMGILCSSPSSANPATRSTAPLLTVISTCFHTLN